MRARLLHGFDAQQGSVCDGQRTTRTWLVNCLRVTKGQAGEYKAIQGLAGHEPLLAGLRDRALTKSVALLLARWTNVIPEEFRGEAEEILVTAARDGVGLQSLAAMCAEIRERTAPPDPDDDPADDPRLDRTVVLDTTIDGVGVLRGDLTAECAAMVRSVLDALSAPTGGDLRTGPQRYHDALEEAHAAAAGLRAAAEAPGSRSRRCCPHPLHRTAGDGPGFGAAGQMVLLDGNGAVAGVRFPAEQ